MCEMSASNVARHPCWSGDGAHTYVYCWNVASSSVSHFGPASVPHPPPRAPVRLPEPADHAHVLPRPASISADDRAGLGHAPSPSVDSEYTNSS